MEQSCHHYAQWVSKRWTFTVSDGSLRTTCPSSSSVDGENTPILRRSVGRCCLASRTTHQSTWWHLTLQVILNNSLIHSNVLLNLILCRRVERSSDQVVKPINLEALSKWVGQIPEDVIRDMSNIAPMLSTFGYDPRANPPNYGDADQWVANNTLKVAQQERHWMNKTQELLKAKKQQQSRDEFDDKFID